MDENKKEHNQPEYDKENPVESNTESSKNRKAFWDVIKNGIEDKEIPESNDDIEKLKAELEKALEERDSLTEKYQRTFSDFNNYKRRSESQLYQAVKNGECDTIEKILPVLDNMERALEHIDDKDKDAVSKGVSMVYKQLTDIIAGMGVTEIPALGIDFDPNLHQAIQQVDAKEGEKPGTIAVVAQKGYMQGDRVLRHSMVVVNK